MERSSENRAYVHPEKGAEGDIILLRLPTTLPLTENLEVRVGEREALDVVAQDEHTLLFRLPDGDAGSKGIVVLAGGRELVQLDAAITHIGQSRQSVAQANANLASRASVSTVQMEPISQTNPASNWWMLHRDLAHAANDREDSVTPLRKLWQQTFPDPVLTSQPIVGDGLVLVALISGLGTRTFAALDEQTGQVRWVRDRLTWEWDVTGHPVAANGRVYFVERYWKAKASELICLRISDGALVWSTPLPPDSTESITGAGLAAAFAKVYCNLSNGKLHAYRADSGTLEWEADVEVSTGTNSPSPPAIGFGNVYVGSTHGLRAFDANDGTLRWAATAPGNGIASPVIVYDVGDGNPATVVIGGPDRTLRAYVAGTGWLRWELGNVSSSGAPATANGRLYLGNDQATRIVEVDAVSGTQTAISPDLGGRLVSPPTVNRERLLAVVWRGSQFGRIVVLRLAGLAIDATVDIPASMGGFGGRAVAEGMHVYISANPNYEAAFGGIAIHAFEPRAPLSRIEWWCRQLPDWLRRLLCPASARTSRR